MILLACLCGASMKLESMDLELEFEAKKKELNGLFKNNNIGTFSKNYMRNDEKIAFNQGLEFQMLQIIYTGMISFKKQELYSQGYTQVSNQDYWKDKLSLFGFLGLSALWTYGASKLFSTFDHQTATHVGRVSTSLAGVGLMGYVYRQAFVNKLNLELSKQGEKILEDYKEKLRGVVDQEIKKITEDKQYYY